MNPTLFSVLLSVVFCASFIRGSPVEPKNETEKIKIVPTNIPVTAVTTLSPSTTEYADLKSDNKTNGTKIETVISIKTNESPDNTESAHTETNTKTANTTTNTTNTAINVTNTATTNTTIPSSKPINPATIAPSTGVPIPTQEITTKIPTTVTVSSTKTHTVTILPTSKVEEKEKDRGFDGPSFIGGIVLALGLTGIGFVAYKFCKARTDRNYRNL